MCPINLDVINARRGIRWQAKSHERPTIRMACVQAPTAHTPIGLRDLYNHMRPHWYLVQCRAYVNLYCIPRVINRGNRNLNLQFRPWWWGWRRRWWFASANADRRTIWISVKDCDLYTRYGIDERFAYAKRGIPYRRRLWGVVEDNRIHPHGGMNLHPVFDWRTYRIERVISVGLPV